MSLTGTQTSPDDSTPPSGGRSQWRVRLANWLPLCVPLGVGVGLVWALVSTLHGTVVNVDGIYTSQVSRNLLHGKGYSTLELPLYQVNAYYQTGILSQGPPWSNNLEFPLDIVLKAPFIYLSNSEYFDSTTLPSVVFFFATAASLYFVTLRLFARPLISSIATLLFVSSPLALVAAVNQKDISLDMFVFVVILYALISLLRSPSPSIRQFAFLGITLGLAYLARFNMGIVLGVSVLPLVYIRLANMHPDHLAPRIRSMLVLIGAIGLVVSPLLIYNWYAFGTPLSAGNFGMQLVAFTPADKGMNPWWQLNYAPNAYNPIRFVETNLIPLQSKFTTYLYNFFLNTLLLGYQPIGGSVWWWAPIGYLALRRLERAQMWALSSKESRWLGMFTWIISFNIVTSSIALSLLAGTIEYFEYLIPAIAILAGLGIVKLLDDFTRWRANHAMAYFSKRGLLASQYHSPRWKLAWTGGWARNERSVLLSIIAVLCVVPPAYGVGIIPGPAPYQHASPEWLTNHDPTALLKTCDLTAPGTIDLTPQPWNVAWFCNRPALPLPPYPDDIYTMIQQYHLNVSTIYLSDLDSSFFNSIAAPYTYSAYRYLTFYGETIAGFTIAYRGNTSFGPDEVLVRSSQSLSSTVVTTTVPFGSSVNVSHLDWGWSAPTVVSNLSANWATIPGGIPVPLIPNTVYYSCGGLIYVEGTCIPALNYTLPESVRNASHIPTQVRFPEAEISFFVGVSPPSTIHMQVLAPFPSQNVRAVLDGNLDFYGQSGVWIGDVSIASKDVWVNVTFAIPPGSLRQGLNTLDFEFGAGEYVSTDSFGFPVSDFIAVHELSFS
jgi:hypothetical protein